MTFFEELSDKEAQAYFDKFIGAMPSQLDRLRQMSESTGGPTAKDLDLSINSLQPIWEWAAGRVAWRPGYVGAPAGEPQPLVDLATVEPAQDLPEWFSDWPQLWAQFSAPTLWLIDGFGRYLGETLVASFPGAKWKIGKSHVKGFVFQNHPVVSKVPLVGDVEPIRSTFSFVRQQLDGRSYATPYELLSRWAASETDKAA
jgi:hypothetical protein